MRITLKLKTKLIDREELLNKQKRVLFLAMNKMEEIAKRLAPVDTGILRNKISLFPAFPGQTKYVLSDGVDYGIHVEYGTNAHWAPIDPLLGWCKRKFGDATGGYGLQKKIAMKGTPAQPFFRPSLRQVKKIWLPIYWKEVFG
jgi:hypothetical protein